MRISKIVLIASLIVGCATAKRNSEPKLSIEEKKILQETQTVKLEISSKSEWDEIKYDISEDIKEKISNIGLEVTQNDSDNCDATLFVDYKETKGDFYLSYGNAKSTGGT